MCRAPSRPSGQPPLLSPLSLLLLLLTAATAAAQVHVPGPTADIELLPDLPAELSRPVNYDGHQVLRVLVADNATAELLRSYAERPGVSFWSENPDLTGPEDVLVSPTVRRELTDKLNRSGASYTVMIDNVQSAIEEENPRVLNRLVARGSLQQSYLLTWRAYHRLSHHHQYMDFIGQNYRGLCETFSIGSSTEGRDIKGVKCGLGRREIWMDGGIHAREWISPAVVSYLIKEFSENSIVSQDILKEFTLYIVPVLNPDGYEYTHTGDRMWRKTRSRNAGSTCIGVDANRNFDISWGKSGTSKNPCAVTYGGPEPFSEPETRAIRDFVLDHAGQLEMFITFHSYSELLYVPYAYDIRRPSDYNEVRRVAERGVAAIEASSGRSFDIPTTTQFNKLSGVSDDWAKAVAGVKYTYTFELRDKGKHGFLLPAVEIEPSGREIAAAVKAMIRALPRQGGSRPRQRGSRARKYGRQAYSA